LHPSSTLFPYTTLFRSDEIVKSDALREAAQLAEVLGCPAYQSSTPYGAHFLSESPCFMGALARIQKIARDTLAPYDLIIALGGRSEEHTSELQSRSDLV